MPFPTVNYIGNKEKLTDWIIENMPVKNGTVLDLFCGGCSVSYALKEKGYTVHSNDVLYSNYVLAKALIENNKVKLEESDLNVINSITIDEADVENARFLSNTVYFSNEIEELSLLVKASKMFKGSKKHMFLSLLRRAMIRKIPYSRMNIKWEEIQKLRDEEYSYKKYGRYRHYHNIPFISHINENLNEYNAAVFDNSKNNKAFQKDCFEYLRKTKFHYDVIYIDPPYPGTMNKYHDFYGKYDKLFGKEIKYTDLSNKLTFIENFEKLIALISKKTDYAIISLNENTIPSPDKIITMIKKYGKTSKKEKRHVYKVTGITNKNRSKELLLIVEFKGIK